MGNYYILKIPTYLTAFSFCESGKVIQYNQIENLNLSEGDTLLGYSEEESLNSFSFIFKVISINENSLGLKKTLEVYPGFTPPDNSNIKKIVDESNPIKEISESIANEIIQSMIFKSNDKTRVPTPKSSINSYDIYINAIRTKPFLLLAGISGTGKSRIVRELAFKSCPPYLRDNEGTTPGNYCMIEVKPNWHDSTEVLGYYSNLNERYQFTKFVRFLVKAKMFPNVPFFLCLDEMNLAPVEQYFAEILSILETRKHPKKEDGTIDMEHIQTGVIVEPKYFQEDVNPGLKKFVSPETGASYSKTKGLTDWEIYLALDKPTKEEIDKQSPAVSDEIKNSKILSEHGLTLPDNVIIIGTVNMDDTTHQFSRKVIDRAMTIEMNGGNLKSMFGGSKKLEYIDDKEEQERWQCSFKQPFVNADEVIEVFPEYADEIIEKLPKRLEEINQALKGTPFEVSYRVLNELIVMIGVMLEYKTESQSFDNILNEALDNILLMKILPRIEGDADMFNLKDSTKTRLHSLLEIAPVVQKSKDEPEEEDSDEEKTQKQEARQTAREKIQEMIERLENQEFTRFWP